MAGGEIKILMVDDDVEDFMITEDILAEIPKGKYILDLAPDYNSGLDLIKKKSYDVYLVDYRLGPRTGLELIEEAFRLGCEAPLILLTGQNDIEVDEKALKAGAFDYLVKGTISSKQLERSIRYSLQHAKDMKEIRELNIDLEKRVKDRTVILEEALEQLEKNRVELKIAYEKEKELNELKSRFVTMASHEFRTPLGAILSSTDLIAKYVHADQDEKVKKHIDRVKSSVKNLVDILNDFLSLEKLEDGKTEVNKEIFDLKDFIENTIDELSGTCKAGQQIEYEHKGEHKINADKKLLKNTLLNLISNAIKYSPAGKTISVTAESEPGKTVLKVKDEGLGIPEAEQKNMFTKFFRAANVTDLQGTGLGLTIVKRYVELMEGTITFVSRENEGSVFIVTIPAK